MLGNPSLVTYEQFSLMLEPHLEIWNWQQTPNPEAQFPIDAPPFEVHSSDVKQVPISEACFRDP